MPKKREFRWTRESKRKDAEKTTATALAIADGERSQSIDKVARLRALRLARNGEEPIQATNADKAGYQSGFAS